VIHELLIWPVDLDVELFTLRLHSDSILFSDLSWREGSLVQDWVDDENLARCPLLGQGDRKSVV
jgi:hypothetical protein